MASKSNGRFSFFPTVKAQDEAEMVDPQAELREKCDASAHVEHLKAKYTECNDRVNSRSKTTETCVEELFDYLHELDHCVGKTLWSKLK